MRFHHQLSENYLNQNIIMRINTQTLTGWKVATKVRPIKAKHVKDIVDVRSLVFDKLLLQTCEGNESLKTDAMICMGEAGDVWQQTTEKFYKKYDYADIDINGWKEYTPKPENEVNCVEVTPEMNSLKYQVPPYFTIVGQWGETVNGVANVQSGAEGAFICQNRTDPTDVWIVKRKLFLNTYIIKS